MRYNYTYFDHDICVVVSDEWRCKMDYLSILKKKLSENKGVLLSKEVDKLKIPRKYISKLVEQNILEKVDRGIYFSTDNFEDEMFKIQAKYKQSVFSHETALYLHDLTDRDPLKYSVTVKSGYKYTNLSNNGIKVYTIKKDFFDIGIIQTETPYGHTVNTYNMERTICDTVRSRNRIDSSVFADAIKRYVAKSSKNLQLLMEYAEKFMIKNILSKYLEVML